MSDLLADETYNWQESDFREFLAWTVKDADETALLNVIRMFKRGEEPPTVKKEEE